MLRFVSLYALSLIVTEPIDKVKLRPTIYSKLFI